MRKNKNEEICSRVYLNKKLKFDEKRIYESYKNKLFAVFVKVYNNNHSTESS